MRAVSRLFSSSRLSAAVKAGVVAPIACNCHWIVGTSHNTPYAKSEIVHGLLCSFIAMPYDADDSGTCHHSLHSRPDCTDQNIQTVPMKTLAECA